MQSPKQRMKQETITPKRAREWLERNDQNRPIRAGWVSYLVGVIKRGEWELNGHTIKIDPEGGLLDGQHRLMACDEADKPIESWVCYNVPRKAFTTVDTGTARSLGDLMSLRGITNYNHVASAVRYYWLITEVGGFRQGGLRISNQYGLDLLDKHPKLATSVDDCLHWRLHKLAPTGLCSAAHYIARKKHAKEADKFFESLGLGTGMTKTKPVYLLREAPVRMRLENVSWERDYLCQMLAKAWNSTVQKKRLTELRLEDGDRKVRFM